MSNSNFPAYAIGAFINELPAEVLSALRSRGRDDAEIERMSPREAFDEYCTWHGLIHWGDTLYAVAGQLQAIQAQIEGDEAVVTEQPEVRTALTMAESFMAGFEDDEVQENLAEKLTMIRTAIAKTKGQSIAKERMS